MMDHLRQSLSSGMNKIGSSTGLSHDDSQSDSKQSMGSEVVQRLEKLLALIIQQLMQCMNGADQGEGEGGPPARPTGGGMPSFGGGGGGGGGLGGIPQAPAAGAPAAVNAAAAPRGLGQAGAPGGGADLAGPGGALGDNKLQSKAVDKVEAPSGAAEAGQVLSPGSVNGGGSKEINLKNNTDKPMQIAFFRNAGKGKDPSFNGPEATFTIPPNSSKKISMPDDWQGRVQKFNGSTQDHANWAEINFEKGQDAGKDMDKKDKIWFNESDIPGRNSSIKITSGDGVVAGSDKSILDKADPSLITKDSAGEKTLKAPQWFDGKTNQGSVDFLNKALGTENAYVLPDDNKAVRMSHSNSLTVEFGKA